MTDITLYGFAPSTYVRTARWICEEKGIGYRLAPLEFHQPSHYALHPFGRMPVLRHGNITLFETLAIGVYLDEAFRGASLTPTDVAGRARMFQWISSSVDYLYADLVRGLIEAGDADASETIERARRDMAIVDRALNGQPFLAGKNLSLADLFLAPMLDYVLAHPQGAGLLDGHKKLSAWRDALWSRPGYARSAVEAA